MIAPHGDRKPPCQRGLGRISEALGPGDGLGQAVQLGVRHVGVGGRCHIADIRNTVAEAFECGAKPSCAVGVRPHDATPADFATIQKGALKYAVLRSH